MNNANNANSANNVNNENNVNKEPPGIGRVLPYKQCKQYEQCKLMNMANR